MSPPPNPLPLGDTIEHMEDATTFRRLHCTKYDACLTTADRNGWKSFTCNRCKAFAPVSEEQTRADDEAILEGLLVRSADYDTSLAQVTRRRYPSSKPTARSGGS